MKKPNMSRVCKTIGVILLISFGLALVAGGLFALEVLSRKPQIAVLSTTHASIERKACLDCHAPIADEWRESYHYKSLSGPYWNEVQGYVDLFTALRKACVNCHAPANILDLPDDAEISAAAGDTEVGVECTPNLLREPKGITPAARLDDVELGVDCVACHVSRQGITGAGRRPTTEHRTFEDPRFQDPVLASDTLCGTCHRSTVQAWKTTKFALDGVTCLDCHMPAVSAPSFAGGPERSRRSHRFPADKDELMLRKAVNAALEITGDRRARLRISNDSVGHHLPSGANWLLVYIKAYDANGRVLGEHREALGREEGLLLDFWPFNSDKRIPFGEHRDILFSLPEGHGRVEATVRYHDWMRRVRTVVTLNDDY